MQNNIRFVVIYKTFSNVLFIIWFVDFIQLLFIHIPTMIAFSFELLI